MPSSTPATSSVRRTEHPVKTSKSAGSSAALRPSRFERRERRPVRRHAHREPPVGDLRAQLGVLRATGAQPDRYVGDGVHDRAERFALADRSRSPVRQGELRAVVTDRAFSGEHLADDGHVIAEERRRDVPTVGRTNLRRSADPTRRSRESRAHRRRARRSSWRASRASPGGRAASCAIPVPSLIRSVNAARYASGESASAPYASALHTE